MAEFEFFRSFDIDNGELDNLSREMCFVLGYELSKLDEHLEAGGPISMPVHAENKDRVQKSCLSSGRGFRLSWMQADQSESWMWLEVDDDGR